MRAFSLAMETENMKSWWIDGSTGKLELRDVPVPQPGPNEIVIRLKAAGLNRGEFIHGHGLHKVGSAKPSGFEGAGEVTAVGAGITRFKVGDAVMGRTHTGFSEYSILSDGEALPKPAALSWEEAAGASLAQWVAYDMVAEGEVVSGDWVLVTGISSGVGVGVLQIAKARGAKVIGTSGSAQKLERLKAHGLDAGIVARGGGFRDEVLRLTDGKGVKLAVNNVGGTAFPDALGSLGYRGRIGIVGYVDGSLSATVDLEAVHAKRLRIFGVSNKNRPLNERAETVTAFQRDVLPLYANGSIKPLIDQVLPFDQLPAAREAMEKNTMVGKIVVKMG